MKRFIRLAVFSIVCAFTAINAEAQKNPDLAPSPIMGWNSWNWYGKQDIDEEACVAVIDAIVESGLKDAGYEYFVVDGGWRDGLNEKGEIKVDLKKFPRGMKFLADYAHSKGLKFGLHTVPGKYDCGGDRVGGLGNEEAQMQQFVDWGLDFIKLDRCTLDYDADHKKIPWDIELEKELYLKWSKMLRECGRDIVFSISSYRPLDWHPEWCNMARTTGDIMSRYNGGAAFEREDLKNKKRAHNTVMEIADKNEPLYAAAGNGYWNDMDMLSIGEQGLTVPEQQIHFALWCIMSSPLILGNDPCNMTPEEFDIITNRDAIAVNQDPSGQGRRVYKEGGLEIWKKDLKKGNYALLLLNRDKSKQTLSVDFEDLGLKGKYKVTDIYAKKNLGKQNSFSTEFDGRGCAFLLLE